MPRTTVRIQALVAFLVIAGCTESTEPELAPHMRAASPASVTGIVGELVASVPSIIVTEDDGTPIAGVSVLFTVTGGGTVARSSAVTGKDGTASVDGWQLGGRTGTQTLTATASGFPNVVFTALALPATVASMTLVSGQDQKASVGSELSAPLRVRVSDRFGNSCSGAIVFFEVVSGAGTIENEDAVADLNGVATAPGWRLGPEPGRQQAKARTGSLELLFTAEAVRLSTTASGILFVVGDQIYSRAVPTGANTQITFGGQYSYPALSPDGRRIAFVRFSGATSDIYLMNADGSNVSRLTVGMDLSYPSWSPDGRSLAAATSDMPYWGEIYLLDADKNGKSPVKIASGASMPTWSPDGKRIAFVALSGDDGFHALEISNVDGSGIVELVPQAPHSINHPAWSPDGTRIAFSECNDAKCEVNVISLNGALLWKTSLGSVYGPRWSPDGRWLAFTFSDWVNEYVAFTDASGKYEVTMIGQGRTW